MIDDALVLKVERLRDGVVELRDSIRAGYRKPNRPVVAQDLRDSATQLGERWLVEIAARSDVGAAIGTDHLADLNVEFQRILTYAEQATVRRKYDSSTTAILRDFRNRIIVPLKQQRGKEPIPVATLSPPPGNGATVAFIGQSCAASHQTVNSLIQRFLEAFGITVLTGEKPKADKVSAKVRERIEKATIFLGIFCRRDKIVGRSEWTTSAWVIDEKAYALARQKKLIFAQRVRRSEHRRASRGLRVSGF